MQLYFYDTDETIAYRVKRSPKLDTSMIRLILRILQDNPYVLLFKNLGSVSNIAEYNIELNTSISVDQRRYNAPGMDQVAAIWMDGEASPHKRRLKCVTNISPRRLMTHLLHQMVHYRTTIRSSE